MGAAARAGVASATVDVFEVPAAFVLELFRVFFELSGTAGAAE
jgi:hypothetical protein